MIDAFRFVENHPSVDIQCGAVHPFVGILYGVVHPFVGIHRIHGVDNHGDGIHMHVHMVDGNLPYVDILCVGNPYVDNLPFVHPYVDILFVDILPFVRLFVDIPQDVLGSLQGIAFLS